MKIRAATVQVTDGGKVTALLEVSADRKAEALRMAVEINEEAIVQLASSIRRQINAGMQYADVVLDCDGEDVHLRWELQVVEDAALLAKIVNAQAERDERMRAEANKRLARGGALN